MEFMWANVMEDGSVLMGLRVEGSQRVEVVTDPDKQWSAPNIQAPRLVSRPKISFHSGGIYKLDATVGLTESSIDRATVVGPRLDAISAPRRMLEILLPTTLAVARTTATAGDIVLEASAAPASRLICTISCMAGDVYHQTINSRSRFVSTSTWETTRGLESGTPVWAWTLRASTTEIDYPDQFRLALLGDVKWGREVGDGA